jgi:hypothetical protein
MGRMRPAVLILVLALLLPSCGGGSSSGGVPAAPTPLRLTGTAATGAAIGNAPIEAKDRNGTLVSGTTAADGTFDLEVTGLTAPYLLKVTPAAGPALFSVGSQEGVVALTPLTDMVIRNYYRARGLVLEGVYASLGGSDPVPTAAEVTLVATQVRDLIAQWLRSQGIDPETFDLMTVDFAADGTGFDAVLDLSTVTDNGTETTLSVVSGTVTQTTTVAADGGSATMSASTETTDSVSGGVTNSLAETLVPFATDALAALTGVNAALEQLRSAANAAGASLTAAQVATFMDADLLHDGTDRTQQSAEIAALFRSIVIQDLRATRVHSFDAVNDILDVQMGILYESVGGGGVTEDALPMSFRKSGDDWLMYGNRRIADVGVQVEMLVENLGTVDAKRKINVDIRALQGSLETASVVIHCPSDPTLFNNTSVPHQGTQIRTFEPTSDAGDDFDTTWDVFFAQALPTAFPPPGTVFEITVTPAGGGGPITYQVRSGATTTETTALTPGIAGNDIADILGEDLGLTWTLPTTFLVVKQEYSIHCENVDSESVIVDPSTPAGPDTTGGTLIVPTMVNGKPVVRATVNVNQNGRNGERIIHLYVYD